MARKTINRSTAAEALSLDTLAVFTVNTTKAGKVRSVREYVSTDTGEIIPADQLGIPTLDLREKLPARSKALESLRPEVRKFASFVLCFANLRRGITPGIGTLCQWYGELHERQSSHIRRYIGPLMQAGILAGETLLGPLFQRTGGRAKDHLGEEFRASCIYSRMRMAGTGISATPTRAAPAVQVAAEVLRLRAEHEADRTAWAAIRTAARMPEAAHA